MPPVEPDVKDMLARELHDRVAQTLTGMLMDLENFKSQQVGWDDVLKELELVQTSTREVLSSLRQLLHELRGEQGLVDFTKTLDGQILRFEQRTGIGVILEVREGWPGTLAPAASLQVSHIIDEALNNVRQHSGARTVRIVLGAFSEEELILLVVDDGRGMGPEETRLAGLGTIGMKERAVLLGGRLTLESIPGEGTAVTAVFPRSQVAFQDRNWIEQIVIPEPAPA